LSFPRILFFFIAVSIFFSACQPGALRDTVEPHPVTGEGLIASALYAAERIESDEVRSDILRNTALMKLHQDDMEKAFDYASRIPVQNRKDQTSADIAIFLGDNGERDRARSVANQIQSDYHKSRALAGIAVAYERAGQYRHGRQLAEEIPDPNFQARAFADIAVIYYAEGYRDLGSRIFNQALQAVRREQSITHHIETLVYISQKYIEAGQQRQSREIFSDIMQLTNEIGNEQHLVSTWGVILQSYDEMGQSESIIDNALSVALGMGENASYYRDEMINRVAIAYASRQSYDRMSDALEEIGDLSLRVVTIAESAMISDKNGDDRRADDLFAQAIDLSEQIPDGVFKERALRNLGVFAANAYRFDMVDMVMRKLRSSGARARLASRAAQKALDTNDKDVFARYLKQSVQELDAIDDRVAQAESLFAIAELHNRSGMMPDKDTNVTVSKILYGLE
jgi:tetratricopeptide (TPR) repeat protein